MIKKIENKSSELYKYVILFIVISFLNVLYLNSSKEDSKNEYIISMSQKNVMAYKTIYNQYEQLSNVIYSELMQNEKILRILLQVQSASIEDKNKLRDALYKSINNRYSTLTQYHLRQLHFHLPNNESFLRFHKPEKFGDNLTGIRKTVEYVNQTLKPIDGFEEGRIYNGFRFVYPVINNKNQHLGSVEVSFGADAFINSLMDEYDVVSNFFIKEEVVDKKVFESEKGSYSRSCQIGYLYDKNVLSIIEQKRNVKVDQIQSDASVREAIREKIEFQDVVSIYDKKHDWLVTAIAFHNPITKKMVAFLTIRSKSIFFSEIRKNFFQSIILTEVFLLFLFYFVYRQIRQKNALNTILTKKVNEQTRYLQKANATLEEKIKEAIEEVEKKNSIIVAQSRHVAMGEMISMIAHQWRQPLSVISMSVNNVKLDIDLDDINKEELKECTNEISSQIEYLTHTIDDFSNFFKPNKDINEITFSQLIDNSLKIIGKAIENNHIELSIEINTQDTINTYNNELVQVLINILNNAKEACVDNKIQEPKISIICEEIDDMYQIRIHDNAGGIPKDISTKIYDPYFSTKNKRMVQDLDYI